MLIAIFGQFYELKIRCSFSQIYLQSIQTRDETNNHRIGYNRYHCLEKGGDKGAINKVDKVLLIIVTEAAI